MQIPSKSVARTINILSNKIRRQIDSAASRTVFSGAQDRVLHFILAQTEDIFQKDIEEEFGLRPPTASELLKKMERNELLRREPVSYDARLKKIIVSEKALIHKDQVISDVTELEDRLTRGISIEELDTFFRIIEKMSHNLS